MFSNQYLICLSFLLFFNCIKDAGKVSPIKIEANGFLTEGDKKYHPENIMDQSSHPWCISKSTKIPSFSVIYDQKVKITILHFLNGYAKNKLFLKNKRIAKLSISNDDNEKIEVVVPDERESYITLPKELSGKRFTFIVNESYNGNTFDDLCLSELAFSREEFNGYIYYDAFCDFLEQGYKSIVFDNASSIGEEFITLYPDGDLDVYLGSPQMEVRDHTTGNWKADNEGIGTALEGKYLVKREQYGNGDLSDENPKIIELEFSGKFILFLQSDKKCTKLDGRAVKILHDNSDIDNQALSRGDIFILR